MFKQIKSFLNSLYKNMLVFFNNLFRTAPIINLTEQEKYKFVKFLLNGQDRSVGFALRHVDNNETKDTNINYGFRGDAISLAITPLIMSAVFNERVEACSWHTIDSDNISFMTNRMSRPLILDQQLAVKIFDCWHEKVLQFIKRNFFGDIHHFMLIKKMNGATAPYDIKDIYPTGKCGKQNVQSSQIVKVFCKSNNIYSAEAMLHHIEKGILQLAKPTKHFYSQESTLAILAVLQEINLSPNDNQLVSENIHHRLIEAEVQTAWSEHKYHNFYDTGGYLDRFDEIIPHVNEDIDYFRTLI